MVAITQKKLKELIELSEGMLEDVKNDKLEVGKKLSDALNNSNSINIYEDENVLELSENYSGLSQTQNYYQGRKDVLDELLRDLKSKK